MAVADKQLWVLGKPKISDNDNQIWVFGEPCCVIDSTPAAPPPPSGFLPGLNPGGMAKVMGVSCEC